MLNAFKYVVFFFTCLEVFVFTSQAHAQQNPQTTPFVNIIKSQKLGFPLECTLDEDCWVMNYVDIGPNDGKNTDIACGSRTYDSHKGTDIAILGEKAMEKGVNVLAPANGKVTKIRDGEVDMWPTKADIEKIKQDRKECGNAILIDHENGLQTIYCHLKKGSVLVKPDQEVKKGDIIAQVGQSGMSEFPHLHIGVIKDGKVIDPFTGIKNVDKCGFKRMPYWDKKLDVYYQQISIYAADFSNEIPSLEKIDRENTGIDFIPLDSDLLSFWVSIFGVEEGDKIKMEIWDPNDKLFAERTIIQDKTRARQFYYTGRKTMNIPLIEGAYTGLVTIIRTDVAGKESRWTKSAAILVK